MADLTAEAGLSLVELLSKGLKSDATSREHLFNASISVPLTSFAQQPIVAEYQTVFGYTKRP
jgi:hypothetical protein